MRAWIYLTLSGLFEVGWLVSLKSSDGFSKWIPMIGYALFGLAAAFFLSLSMRSIPMGTAYAVWVGISAVGALGADAAFFRQPATTFRIICIVVILAATFGMRLSAAR